MLIAAAGGTAKVREVSEGQEVHFTPCIVSPPCQGSRDFVSGKDRGIIFSSVTRFE